MVTCTRTLLPLLGPITSVGKGWIKLGEVDPFSHRSFTPHPPPPPPKPLPVRGGIQTLIYIFWPEQGIFPGLFKPLAWLCLAVIPIHRSCTQSVCVIYIVLSLSVSNPDIQYLCLYQSVLFFQYPLHCWLIPTCQHIFTFSAHCQQHNLSFLFHHFIYTINPFWSNPLSAISR